MPVLAVCDVCTAEYRLKDEHSGRKVKCKDCGTVILVPMALAEEEMPPAYEDEWPFGYDRYLINQKRIAISEKYYVFDEQQNPILFIERPAYLWQSLGALAVGMLVVIVGIPVSALLGLMIDGTETKALAGGIFIIGMFASIIATLAVVIRLTPKRHIYVYTDDSKSHLLLEVFQDRKINIIEASYTVRDPKEGVLGQLRKNYLYNFFRKRWDAFRPDGSPLVVAREDSLILSLLRRFLGPMLGLLRTNFVFLRPDTDVVIGEFNRKVTIFDRYVLDMTADRKHELDRRMAVALGILLDTGERR